MELPKIQPNVNDFNQKSRIINIEVEGDDPGISCVPESLTDTLKTLREEQYIKLINIARMLEYKAKAQLKKVFAWHRQEWTGEIDFKQEEDNGGNTGKDTGETRSN